MNTHEHMLAIVEPTPGGDATLELAHETVARGGSATVLMVITDRVQRDIRDFAESEDLGRLDAESEALNQLRAYCIGRIGGEPQLEIHYGPVGTDVIKHISSDTTSIALPARLVTNRLVERLVEYSGRPVIVTPIRAAA